MRRMLITIYFDIEDDKPDGERDFDRFILEFEPNNYREKIFKIFDLKKYSWDDFEKFNKGYKPIMIMDQLDLTELEVFNNDRELAMGKLIDTSSLEEWELEI